MLVNQAVVAARKKEKSGVLRQGCVSFRVSRATTLGNHIEKNNNTISADWPAVCKQICIECTNVQFTIWRHGVTTIPVDGD